MRILRASAAVALLVATSSVAHGQLQQASTPPAGQTTSGPSPAAPGGMRGGGMGGMMSMKHGGGMMMGGMRLQHIEGRIAFLKAELKITPAQEPQWSKFADAMRASAKGVDASMGPGMTGDAPKMSAPEMLSHHEKMLEARLAAARAVSGAFVPLYGALADDQKKLADGLISGPMGVM